MISRLTTVQVSHWILFGAVFLSGCSPSNGGANKWGRFSQGRIGFTASASMSAERGTAYLLTLPSRELQRLRVPSNVSVSQNSFTGPVFVDTGLVWLVVSDQGKSWILEASAFDDRQRKILEFGEWNFPSGHGTDKRSRGWVGQKQDELPGLVVHVDAFDRGSITGTCFALAEFHMDRRLTESDVKGYVTGEMPGWIHARVTAHLRAGVSQWCDMMAIDAGGNIEQIHEFPPSSPIRLSVDASERFFAVYDLDLGVYVFDRREQRVFAPLIPKGTTVRLCDFSTNGQRIAACGYDSTGSAIYICDGPGFTQFYLLHRIPDFEGTDVMWSPDGKWLLVQHTRELAEARIRDYAIMEVATGEITQIPRPYLLDGEPAIEVFATSAAQWGP